jgi:hypothetical protein
MKHRNFWKKIILIRVCDWGSSQNLSKPDRVGSSSSQVWSGRVGLQCCRLASWCGRVGLGHDVVEPAWARLCCDQVYSAWLVPESKSDRVEPWCDRAYLDRLELKSESARSGPWSGRACWAWLVPESKFDQAGSAHDVVYLPRGRSQCGQVRSTWIVPKSESDRFGFGHSKVVS